MIREERIGCLTDNTSNGFNRTGSSDILITETDEIIAFTSTYDFGIYILEPTNLNNHFALPSKLFEFIQARLAIAIGPSPEMAKIVQENQLGIVAADFKPETMAAALNKMTKESMDAFKLNADKAAKILNAEENMKRLHNEIERLLN